VNRYLSSERWQRRANGMYASPCGNFIALKEGHGRWKLIKGRTVYGPYLTLADCQEIAEKKWSVL